MAADDWYFDNDGNIVAVTKAGADLGEIAREIHGDPITEDDAADFAKLLGL
jgi:hypothetical protein